MAAKTKTLIISSDSVMLRFLQQNLNESYYRIVTTQLSGEELRTIVAQEQPDIVILDIMMPNLGGIEVCLRLRQWSQVPIMMLSAWGAGEDNVRGLDLSADSYLTEPFGIDGVTERITETLQSNFAARNLISNISPGAS